jgi:two-component system OmpR family response regulator
MNQLHTARTPKQSPPVPPPATMENTALRHGHRGPLRLFLVEDSKLYRERLAEHLAFACGTQLVGWADSEQPAIEELRRGNWDVLIVDLQLKQGTGLGVLGALPASRRPPGSVTVMLTDHDFYLYKRKAREVGADLFCVKGRDLNQLVQFVRQLDGNRNAEDHN